MVKLINKLTLDVESEVSCYILAKDGRICHYTGEVSAVVFGGDWLAFIYEVDLGLPDTTKLAPRA